MTSPRRSTQRRTGKGWLTMKSILFGVSFPGHREAFVGSLIDASGPVPEDRPPTSLDLPHRGPEE
jgi:hypothetical protein